MSARETIAPSGIPEAIVPGETGFVVPEGAVAPLAERITQLLASPALAARMGAAARALAQREFDLVRQTAKLEHLYAQVIRDGNDRR